MPRSAEEQKAIRAAATKRWREKNKEHHRATQNAWRSANYKEWYVRNAPARTVHNMNYHLRKELNWVEDVDYDVIFNRDEGVCKLCGLEVEHDDGAVDHVIPLSRGGEHSYANTQLSHWLCNCKKGNRDA